VPLPKSSAAPKAARMPGWVRFFFSCSFCAICQAPTPSPSTDQRSLSCHFSTLKMRNSAGCSPRLGTPR
jgi:hypothetical protein